MFARGIIMTIFQRFVLLFFMFLFQANYATANQIHHLADGKLSSSHIITGNNVIFFASKDENIGNKFKEAFNSPDFETKLKELYLKTDNTFKVHDKVHFSSIVLIAPHDNYTFFISVSDQTGKIVMKTKVMVNGSQDQSKDQIILTKIAFKPKEKPTAGVYDVEIGVVKNNRFNETLRYSFALS